MRARILVPVVALSTVVGSVLLAPAADAAPGSHAAASAGADTKVEHRVIVVLKDQPAAEHVGSAAAKQRAKRIKSIQSPLVSDLKQARATHLQQFSLANAIGATVSSDEQARIAADPAVAAVVPDSVVHLTPAVQPTATRAARSTPRDIPGACTADPKGGLEPEALQTMRADSDDGTATTARSLGYTGAGVKVGWVADGIDPNNVNFLRDPADPSSSVFVDYKDFGGDGLGAPTDGAEAFLDANAIAGQGQHVYDVSHFGAEPASTACNIRIEGVAPGASLVGLNVFGGGGEVALTSNIIEAVDYAVQTDHVDVLNESLGSNPFPDISSLDAFKQFNDAAVAAGVTVTASSGDAGPTNTIGSPASDPLVLDVGGSTTLRFYAQTNYGLARDIASTGWLSNNISALASSGFDQDGRTVDLVAPGDLGWSSCDASDTFSGCTNFLGQPSDVEESGGTSMSAPLTAGAAALVIEAYEKAHGGTKPSPAVVKQVLVDTATDLKAPAEEQGAGLVDTVRAVQLAASMSASAGSGARVGATLQRSVDTIVAASKPSTKLRRTVTLTNTGTASETVKATSRTLGGDTRVRTGSVELSDAGSHKLLNYAGVTQNVETFRFSVAKHQDRLDVSYAYPGDPAGGLPGRVRLSLVDPAGQFAGHSIPQGVGNHGDVDVQHPTAGTWTATVFSNVSTSAGTTGKVVWRVATQTYRRFASVSPSTVRIPAHSSRRVTVSTRSPSSPGDQAGSIVFASDRASAGTSTLAVTLRSRVDLGRGGRFAGTLTGGNGRGGQGQAAFYQFRVQRGTRDITADVALSKDAGDPVGLYLIGPDGQTRGYGQASLGAAAGKKASAFALAPQPGLWTLIIVFADPVVGDRVSQPYSGRVVIDRGRASAPGLPTGAGTVLPAGVGTVVPVTVRNPGAAPEALFVDARTSALTTLTLANQNPDSTDAASLPYDGDGPYWFVPSESRSITTVGTGTVPTVFDLSLAAGDPDIVSRGATAGSLCATTTTASLAPSGGQVASGFWSASPAECGPFDAPEPAGSVDLTTTVQAEGFDAQVASPTGDLELTATDPDTTASPIVVPGGGTVTIPVTITPTATAGTVVSGTIYVDDLVDDVPPYGQAAGDELAALPYTYTVG